MPLAVSLHRLPPIAALLLLAAACLAEPRPAEAPPPELREFLLAELNDARERAGARPLRLDPRVTEVAEWHAAELARRGSIRLPAGAGEELGRRLEKAGYAAKEWTEQVAVNSNGPEAVLAEWRRESGAWRAVLRDDMRDVGIGLDRLDGAPLFTFILTVPRGEYYARATAPLKDLERVRREMLVRVNAVRREAGAPPLRRSSLLDRSAQGHAEDMLARSFFNHSNPDGKTVRNRVEAVGYTLRAVGENLAVGPLSVEEVVEGWMNSPGHRANMLDPDYTELGTGLAIGENRKGYQVLWVQNFGRPR